MIMNWKPLDDSHYQRLRANFSALQDASVSIGVEESELMNLAEYLEYCEEQEQLSGIRTSQEFGGRIFFPPQQGFALLNEQRRCIEEALRQDGILLVLSGLGVGHAAKMAYELIQSYPRAITLIYEKNPWAWAAFLSFFPIIDFLISRRMFFFGGESAEADLLQFAETNFLFLVKPDECKYLLGGVPAPSVDVVPYIQDARSIAKAIQSLITPFDEKLNQFTQTMATPLYFPPRSIWGCSNPDAYIHHPIAQAFLKGFEQTGLKTCLGLFEKPIHQQCKVVGSLLNSRPDLLFTVNCWPGALLEDIGLSENTVAAIQHPRICYLVDNTSLYEDARNSYPFSSEDWFFCADRAFLSWLTPQTNQAYYLPIATLFEREGIHEERFAAPITYIGSLPDVPLYLEKLSPVPVDLLVQTEKNCRQGSQLTIVTHFLSLEPSKESFGEIMAEAEEFCSRTNKGLTEKNAILEYFLYNCITFFKRKKIVEALLPLGLKVYGPESWQAVLPTQYKERYGGFVAYDELQNCYYSSQINLNIHSYQCPTCLNIRDFDVPMSGGMVLGDYVEDMDSGLLTPGEEMAVYTTEEEVAETAAQLLRDTEHVAEMRRKAHARVQNAHTFKHRAKHILEVLAKRYNW